MNKLIEAGEHIFTYTYINYLECICLNYNLNNKLCINRKERQLKSSVFHAKVFPPTPQYLCGSDIVQFDCIITTTYISIFLSDLSVRFLKCRLFSSPGLFLFPDQWTVILIKLIRSFVCRPWSHTNQHRHMFNYLLFLLLI